MAESQLMERATASVSPTPSLSSESLRDILGSLVGKTVTVVTSESYEEAPVGHQLKTGFFRAKPVGVGQDVLILHTKRKRKTETEPVKQIIPFASIRRLSMTKTELILHL